MLRKIVAKNIAIFILISLLSCSSSSNAHNKTVGESEEITKLIAELHKYDWQEPEIMAVSPTIWNFGFTDPMEKILLFGTAAQEPLLEKISDSQIKDQVIILLGGVGDERAIEPIINSMIEVREMDKIPNSKKINLCANLALTNITAADVIWPHSGGPVMENCPFTPKICWEKWWKENKDTFSAYNPQIDRRYSHHPNYGIYNNGSGKIIQR